jgi:hypothetical protein
MELGGSRQEKSILEIRNGAAAKVDMVQRGISDKLAGSRRSGHAETRGTWRHVVVLERGDAVSETEKDGYQPASRIRHGGGIRSGIR